jgi:hypothetical protein
MNKIRRYLFHTHIYQNPQYWCETYREREIQIERERESERGAGYIQREREIKSER